MSFASTAVGPLAEAVRSVATEDPNAVVAVVTAEGLPPPQPPQQDNEAARGVSDETDPETGARTALVQPEQQQQQHREMDYAFSRQTVPICPCCPYPRTGGPVGRNILICGSLRKRYFPFLWMVGPDANCLVVTYALIIGPWSYFCVTVVPRMPAYMAAISFALFAIHVLAISVAACSDPGILRDQLTPEEVRQKRAEGLRVCSKCNVVRPPRSHHCYSCETCVMELDHHCPWTGKCIGKHNLAAFQAFLTMDLVGIVYTIVLAGIYFDPGPGAPRGSGGGEGGGAMGGGG